MATIDTIRRVRVISTAEGQQQVVSALGTIANAQRGIASASATTATVAETSARRTLDVSRAYERLRASLEPAVRAQQLFDRTQRTINQALDQGADKAQAYALTVANMQRLQAAGTPTGYFDQTAINGLLGVNDNVSNSARASAEAFEEEYRAIDRMEAAVSKLRAQIDPLSAAQDRLNAEMAEYKAMAAAGAISSNELAAANAMAQGKFDMMAAASGRAGGAVKLNNGQVQNLSYQLNDIGVMLASGQSPFVLLMQQGMQIAQIFKPGTGVGAAVKELGSGLMAFLTNPLTLAVAGVAALAGAIPMIWRSITGGGTNAEEVMKRHAKIVDDVREAYKRAQEGTERWGGAIKNLTFLQAQKNFQDLKKLADESRKALEVSVPRATYSVSYGKGGVGTMKTDPMVIHMAELSNQAANGIITYDAFISKLNEIGRSTSDQKIQKLAFEHQENAIKARDDAKAMKEAGLAMDAVGGSAAAAFTLVNGLSSAFGTAAAAAEGYVAAMDLLGQKIPEIAKQIKIRDELKGASAVYERALSFAGSHAGNETLRDDLAVKAKQRYDEAVKSITGYTDAVKELEKVERDAQIGAMAPREAAIARVHDQFATQRKDLTADGGKQEDFIRLNNAEAQSIANVNRQYDEKAAKVAGQDNAYKTAIENIEQETQMLLAEADAMRLSQVEQDKMLAYKKLELALNEAGIAQTPQIIAGMRAKAEAYALAAKANRETQEAQQRWQEYQSIAQDGFSSFIDDIRKGVSALEAFKNSLERIADRLLQMAIDGAFNMLFQGLRQGSGMGGMGGNGGGIMNMIMGLFSGGSGSGNFGGNGALFANGGIMTSYGSLPLNTYASGGIANSAQMAIFGEGRRPEAYVPLPDGRSIPVTMHLPEPANVNTPPMPNVSMFIPKTSTQAPNVSVHVNNAPADTEANVKTQQGADGKLDVIVDLISKKVKGEIAQDFASGGNISRTAQARFGLKNAV